MFAAIKDAPVTVANVVQFLSQCDVQTAFCGFSPKPIVLATMTRIDVKRKYCVDIRQC